MGILGWLLAVGAILTVSCIVGLAIAIKNSPIYTTTSDKAGPGVWKCREWRYDPRTHEKRLVSEWMEYYGEVGGDA